MRPKPSKEKVSALRPGSLGLSVGIPSRAQKKESSNMKETMHFLDNIWTEILGTIGQISSDRDTRHFYMNS